MTDYPIQYLNGWMIYWNHSKGFDLMIGWFWLHKRNHKYWEIMFKGKEIYWRRLK